MTHARSVNAFRRATGMGIAAVVTVAGLLLVGPFSPAPLTAAAPATAPSGAVGHDWQTFPAVAQVETTHDIYGVGDLHGDYDKAVRLLVGARLLAPHPASASQAKWSGGTSVFVCTGDMIDKWTQGLEILQMMRALQVDAQRQGGQVVVTLGNHEAEFLAAGGSNKKAAEFQKELQARNINPVDFAGGHDAAGLGAWLRNRPVAARVNDWFFCHAGNTAGRSVQELETAVETGVDKDGFGAFVLAQPNSLLEARMEGVPWWMLPEEAAGASAASTATTRPLGFARVRQNVAALGCKHLVVGHQPGKITLDASTTRAAGTPFAYEGVLFLMDTGMSRGQTDGRGVVLHMPAGAVERVNVIDETGKETALWVERQNP